MIKAFAFDLDGTLTQHKTPLDAQNRAILEALARRYTLIMVGAGSCMRIHNQLCGFPMDVIGNYGMQYAKYTDGGLVLVRDDTAVGAETATVEARVSALREKHGFTEFAGNNVEYHASGCLTFPILGTKAAGADKLAFDPDRKKRRRIYGEVCDAFPEYNVFVGGSSSFDMAPKPYNKYYALDLWCRENGLKHDEVVFVGDDYGLGGNDESVYRSDFRFVTTDDYTRLYEVMAPWIDENAPDVAALPGIRSAVIRRGALNELPALCADYGRILLVSDEGAGPICGDRVQDLLGDRIASRITCADSSAIPDGAAQALEAEPSCGIDLIVGIGAQAVHDLCKDASARHHLPYFAVPTVPCAFGCASEEDSITPDGGNAAVSTAMPEVIVADTSVLKNAPLELLRAGIRYIAEHPAARAVAGKEQAILSRDEDGIGALMRAMVLVGAGAYEKR